MVTLPYESRRGVDLADKDLLANESYVYSFFVFNYQNCVTKKDSKSGAKRVKNAIKSHTEAPVISTSIF